MTDLERNQENPKEEPRIDRQEISAFFWEVIKMVVISLAIIVPVRYYLVQPFFVRGASMELSFDNGDYVLIDEITFKFRQPQRGEVIVFRAPKDKTQFYIKRIIGLPGEIIRIKDGRVIIFNAENPEGFILNESEYLNEEVVTDGDLETNIDPNEYFVLGDNREYSSDSRIWGMVNENLISGKVFFRAWPFDKINKFQPIEYSP